MSSGTGHRIIRCSLYSNVAASRQGPALTAHRRSRPLPLQPLRSSWAHARHIAPPTHSDAYGHSYLCAGGRRSSTRARGPLCPATYGQQRTRHCEGGRQRRGGSDASWRPGSSGGGPSATSPQLPPATSTYLQLPPASSSYLQLPPATSSGSGVSTSPQRGLSGQCRGATSLTG